MAATLSTWAHSVREYAQSMLGTGETKRKRLMLLGSLSAACISTLSLIAYYRRQARRQANDELSAYFASESSYPAQRQLFRDAAKAIPSAKQHRLLIDSAMDLYIDLCFIAGAADSTHVVLHFSGTHGVEGYAGSAIQTHLLKHQIPQLLSATDARASRRPHILFVHALNPFGMMTNRRWNKANIDLNRNCILDDALWHSQVSHFTPI